GVSDRDVARGGEHPEHGTADVGERDVDAGERERLRVEDQVGEPQAQGGGVVEDPVKGGAERIEVEQRLVDVEDDDRPPGDVLVFHVSGHGSVLPRKRRMMPVAASRWLSSRKWPPSSRQISAPGASPANARAPSGPKISSLAPQTASSGTRLSRR